MEYWEEVRVQAAVAALQGVLEAKWGVDTEFTPELAADESLRLADALVEKLRKTSKQVL